MNLFIVKLIRTSGLYLGGWEIEGLAIQMVHGSNKLIIITQCSQKNLYENKN